MSFPVSPLLEVTTMQPDSARGYCEQLERGKVLFWRGIPLNFSQPDRDFLLAQKQTGSRFHKNISYRPLSDEIRGVASDGSADHARMRGILRDYSRNVTDFAKRFLAPYAALIKLDFASFRPLEEQGRDLPQKQRNDLLHFDAFPTRPTYGGRILRVFTNINPQQARVWLTGDP